MKWRICEFRPVSPWQLYSRAQPSVSSEGSRLSTEGIAIFKFSAPRGVPPSVPQEVQNVSSEHLQPDAHCVSYFAPPPRSIEMNLTELSQVGSFSSPYNMVMWTRDFMRF